MKEETYSIIECDKKSKEALRQMSESWEKNKHEIILIKDEEHPVAVFKKKDAVLLIEALEKILEKETSTNKIISDSKLKKVEITASDTIKKAIHYIETNFKDAPTLCDVATHVHLNSSYFSVLFREQTALTFSEYMLRKKIQKAKELLLETALPIDKIAEEVGYQSSKHFIKRFKSQEGMTPGKYRKQVNFDRKKLILT